MPTPSLDSFQTIFGEAKLGGSNDSENYSENSICIFMVRAFQESKLQTIVTNFTGHTLQSEFTVEDLLEMKTRIGIAGSFSTFIEFLTSSLSGDSQTIQMHSMPKTPSQASLIGQRAPGEPMIRLRLSSLEGEPAAQAMQTVGHELFRNWKKLKTAPSTDTLGELAIELANKDVKSVISVSPLGEVKSSQVGGAPDDNKAVLSSTLDEDKAKIAKKHKQVISAPKRLRKRGKGTQLLTDNEEN